MSEPQKGFAVNADKDELKGRYANGFSITSQERDVALDFFSHVNTAGQPAQLVARVFLNRFTAQELVEMLQKTISEWEKKRYEVTGGAK